MEGQLRTASFFCKKTIVIPKGLWRSTHRRRGGRYRMRQAWTAANQNRYRVHRASTEGNITQSILEARTCLKTAVHSLPP